MCCKNVGLVKQAKESSHNQEEIKIASDNIKQCKQNGQKRCKVFVIVDQFSQQTTGLY